MKFYKFFRCLRSFGLNYYSFSRSKYFHIVYNEIDRKIDVTAIQFLLVQNRQLTRG